MNTVRARVWLYNRIAVRARVWLYNRIADFGGWLEDRGFDLRRRFRTCEACGESLFSGPCKYHG